MSKLDSEQHSSPTKLISSRGIFRKTARLRGVIVLSALPLALITGLPTAVFSASLSEQNFDQVYVFGDSLSDVGNVFNATGGFYPPSSSYFGGRLSNGPLWVEYLTPKLEANSTNFAYAGSSTGIGNAVLPALPLPGLLTQVSSFTQANPQADPNALYTVWAGANDYLFGGVTDPTGPVGNLSTAVTSLYATGARNIMVANLPDLGKLPTTRVDSQVSSSLDALTEAHNLNLAATLDSLSQLPDIKIRSVDVNALFDEAIAAPTEFNLTNVTDSCLLTACTNPNEYLFWDEYHPTTAGHKLVGDLSFSALETEPVPEPSAESGILALGAIGVVSVLKRKQKKADKLKAALEKVNLTEIGL